MLWQDSLLISPSLAKSLKTLLSLHELVPVLSEKCLSSWDQVIWGLESKSKSPGCIENKSAAKQHMASNMYSALSKKNCINKNFSILLHIYTYFSDFLYFLYSLFLFCGSVPSIESMPIMLLVFLKCLAVFGLRVYWTILIVVVCLFVFLTSETAT